MASGRSREEKEEEGEGEIFGNFSFDDNMYMAIYIYRLLGAGVVRKQRVAMLFSDFAILNNAQTRYSPMGLRQDHRMKSPEGAFG